MRGVLIASLAITAAIFAWLLWERWGARAPQATPIFRYLLEQHDLPVAPLFAAALLLALLPPLRAAGLGVAAWCGRHPATLALATTALLAAGTLSVYHAHPLSMDEYAPRFQSEAFAAGHLAGRFPPELLDWLVPKGFQGVFFKVSAASGEVASMYWPGLALLMTPFSLVGAPWLLNPLIGGATVLVLHRLGRELFADDAAAGLAVLLALASPAVTINAISFYSMAAHLLANALFLLLVLRRTPLSALGAGLVGSLALVLNNPVPHLLFAAPWFAWLALRPGGARLVCALIAGYVPLTLLLGLGWPLYLRGIGSALGAGELATPGSAARTFSESLGSFRPPSEAVFAARILGLAKLWLWAAPALLAAAALGFWRKRDDSGPWLALAGSALLTYFGYFLVRFDGGHGWGYRYFHAAWLVLPLFAVAAARATPLAGFLAAGALLSGLLSGVRAVQVEDFIARHLAQRPAAASGEPRVVIIDPSRGFYAVDLVQNDPFLRGRTVTFITRGRAADEAMMAARFPELRLLASDARGSVWGRP